MPENPIIEKSFPESEIKILEERIAELKELPEGQEIPHPEIVKKAIQSMAPPLPPQTAATDSPVPPDVALQVQNLISKAVNEGIYKANAEAQKSHPFVMDQFHDALTGQLYPELQKRGIVD